MLWLSTWLNGPGIVQESACGHKVRLNQQAVPLLAGLHTSVAAMSCVILCEPHEAVVCSLHAH